MSTSQPKRGRGRPPSVGEQRVSRITPRLLEAEAELLEKAAAKLRRDTGEIHTASSVLRDGGLGYAQKILKGKERL